MGNWGLKEHYKLKLLIEGDFDYYKITFPTTTKNTEFEIIELLRNTLHLIAERVASQIGITKDGVRYYIKKLKDK